MDSKFENLTIREPFMLSKIMRNERLAKRLMEKLTGVGIYKVCIQNKGFVTHINGCDGISVELHLANPQRSIWQTEVYITDSDVFEKGMPIYHFMELCREVPSLRLQEGVHRIFVCATQKTVAAAKSEGLKALLYYVINSGDRRSNLTKMLEDEISRIKRNPADFKAYQLMKRKETEAQQVEYAMQQANRNFNGRKRIK